MNVDQILERGYADEFLEKNPQSPWVYTHENIDFFFKNVYEWTEYKSITNIVIYEICKCITWCSMFLISYEYIIKGVYYPLTISLFILFCIGVCVNIYILFSKIKKFVPVKIFYRDILKINFEQGEEWEDVLKSIEEKTKYNSIEISERILRKDNYFLKFHKKVNFLTQSTYFLIDNTIFRILFYKSWGETNEINKIYLDEKLFQDNYNRLRYYTYIYLGIYIIILPFIIVIASIYYILRYTLQSQSSLRPTLNLFSREWNWKGRWIFRKRNQYPHNLNIILGNKLLYAEKYYTFISSSFVLTCLTAFVKFYVALLIIKFYDSHRFHILH